MNTIVEICWEGRTYDDDSWLADWDVLKTELDPEDPVFVCYYDVSGLFSQRPTFPQEHVLSRIVTTRHGEKTEVVEAAPKVFEVDGPPVWKRYPNLRAWREEAVAEDIIHI